MNPSFPSFYLGTVHPVRKDLKIPSIEPGGLRHVEASDLGLGWGRELSGLPWSLHCVLLPLRLLEALTEELCLLIFGNRIQLYLAVHVLLKFWSLDPK